MFSHDEYRILRFSILNILFEDLPIYTMIANALFLVSSIHYQ